MHADETIIRTSSYDFWSRKSTDEIVESLRPGLRESLKVRTDGLIENGNTRVKVLEERGYDINSVPRETSGPRGALPSSD
jgi:hypothetical protein